MPAGNPNLASIGIREGARLLAVLCHPDDELAIAGSLRRAVSAGVPVAAVWTHSTPMREAESRAAMASLVQGEVQLHFLGGKDKAILDSLPHLSAELSQIVDSFRPTACWCPAFEQGHIDHDATHLLAAKTADCPTWEYPLYHTYLTRRPILNRFPHPKGEIVFEMSAEERALKRRMASMYPSQRIRLNLLAYRIWRTLALRPVDLSATERFRALLPHDYLRPAHGSPTADRILRTREWRRWTFKLAEFRADGLLGLGAE